MTQLPKLGWNDNAGPKKVPEKIRDNRDNRHQDPTIPSRTAIVTARGTLTTPNFTKTDTPYENLAQFSQ
jgi:hypothetical protein